MRDKLTKKRVKVDYALIIHVLNLEGKFTMYQLDHRSNRSYNRQALSFLLREKVDIEGVFSSCIEHGIHSYDEWFAEQCRIAKTKWLDD